MSNYHIKHMEEYFHIYRKSVNTPELFWEEIAEEHFLWRKRWNRVLNWEFETPKVEWFSGAQLNITENCLDRHLKINGEKTAILFEPNNPNEASQSITYNQLYERVNQMANVLRAQGITKGDRVCIYLPMIPELAISLLACARIGAVHSVVFAGFSSKALASRVEDSSCKLVITADGGYRGNKTIDLKSIVDEALVECPSVEKVLVVKRTEATINWVDGRDTWLAPLLESASSVCEPEVMDSEDPLFILYTSGSTGKPKGMVHTTAGYMIGTAYTFKNVFQYRPGDIFWCTADIGWITGHSYIVYGPLLNGATTVLFEGIPTYPDASRFWDVIEKHKITHFYTAPTAIRSLAKEGVGYLEGKDLSSLKILGSVGEPINDEAWKWMNDNVGKKNCPIVDTWWQTETGSIMISPIPYITPTIPTYATLPLPGIQPAILTESSEKLSGNQVEGHLCIGFPWPAMARTIWGDHQRYKETYFSAHKGYYFTGDSAYRDAVGYYRITGRVDDVIIVSGHNLGTAPIEDAINEHPAVAESAIVGVPHDIKGSALYGYVMLTDPGESRVHDNLRKEINQLIADKIGPIAKLDYVQFVNALPKTRSGKIMRRILRKVAHGEMDQLGDTSTLINPECVQEIIEGKLN